MPFQILGDLSEETVLEWDVFEGNLLKSIDKRHDSCIQIEMNVDGGSL